MSYTYDSYRMINRVVLLGQFGPPFLAFARSCKAQNIAVYLLEINSRKTGWQRYSSCLTGGNVISPEKIGTPEGIATVRDYVISVYAEALIAVSDSHLLWLAQNRAAFEPECELLVPSISVLELLASKQNQIELAKIVGFDVLPTWYLSGTGDYTSIPMQDFPVCLRPSDPMAVKPIFKVKVMYSPAELRAFLNSLHLLGHPIIAQPFLKLPNLVVHGVRSETGKMLALEAFLVPRKFEGVTLSILRTDLPSKIERCCRKFAEASGVTGCFHYELLFLPQEDSAYFLEINTRLGGTTEKVLRLGFDEPALSLAAFGLKGQVKTAHSFPRWDRVVNKRTLMKHILTALRGGLSELDYPPVSRARHVLYSCFELCFVKDSVFDWHDIPGSLWFHLRSP